MKKLWQQNGMLLVCALLFLVLSFTVPNFATVENAKGLTMSVTTVGIVACTMLFCLAAGDFDLSVGSVVALAGVVAATVINKTNSIPLAIAIPIALGFGIGAVNGFVIARLGINALITTLATMQIVRGIARLLADGSSIGISNEAFGKLGQLKLLEFQSPVWVMVLCFVVFGLLLNKTIYGRNTLAIGGNAEAARLSGVNVARTKILIFAVQGAIAALAGVLLASRVSSGQPNTSEGLELQVISGCVLGGVSLTGGVGTISGMIVGVLIMGAVQNAMNLLNIPTFWQLVASGAILLTAVLLDKLKNRRRV
ncbi:L-arabinose ABC transporter permease AraH [Armatimonas rosea]|uniref:L-arabinose transport system permease protein n=1 Tax=Armatimonas rosea TaxID=685828 RepID=A0A7W9SPP7_ARMRO|nr:L-arabinose ABC transporter permease AraH [Armatimonas rosea]MBB6050525.1 L-arabinose transport system permease protein [Armatimonas rosea]